MTSQGALRAGAGLVEVFVPEEILRDRGRRRADGSDGQAAPVLSQPAQREDGCLGLGARPLEHHAQANFSN